MIGHGGIADEITSTLNDATGGMTMTWVVTFAFINPDGDKSIETVVDPDARIWEIMGLVEHARMDCQQLHADEFTDYPDD